MGRITAEIAPGTDHPTLDSIKQRNTHTWVIVGEEPDGVAVEDTDSRERGEER